MPRNVDERLVILDIDEKSLGEIGRWPWNRERMATLMNKLFDRNGIALLGFDVVFAEPDDSSGLPVLDSLAKKEGREGRRHPGRAQDLQAVAGLRRAVRRLAAETPRRPRLLPFEQGGRQQFRRPAGADLAGGNLYRPQHRLHQLDEFRRQSAGVPEERGGRRSLQSAGRLRWHLAAGADAGRVQGRLLRVAVAGHGARAARFPEARAWLRRGQRRQRGRIPRASNGSICPPRAVPCAFRSTRTSPR